MATIVGVISSPPPKPRRQSQMGNQILVLDIVLAWKTAVLLFCFPEIKADPQWKGVI